MSDNTPSGDAHDSAPVPSAVDPEQSEAEPTTPDILTGFDIPDPKPVGANPFLVITWGLYTGWVAARLLTVAREKRVEELGRKMRTEHLSGVETLHWEDDVDRHRVEQALDERIRFSWHESLRDARRLCAEFRIPFETYDPLLKAAEEKMNDVYRIVGGVCSDAEVHAFSDLNYRLSELADSTTPFGMQTGFRSAEAVERAPGRVQESPPPETRGRSADDLRQDANQPLYRGGTGTSAADAPSAEETESPTWDGLGEAKQEILSVLSSAREALQNKELAKVNGKYSPGTLTHHYTLLQQWGFISKGKDGYSITPTGRALIPTT